MPEDKNTPEITEQMWRCAERLIVFFERLDREEYILNGGLTGDYEKNPKPTVLVFLPGIFEIKQMHNRLEKWSEM